MIRENPFKRVQQARTPEEFIGASKDEVLRAGEGGAPAVVEPPAPAPVAPVAAAPAPMVAEESVRRDDGSLASQIPIPVNFKLNESVYWEIKHAVRRMPKMSLRLFLEEAAIEKLAKLKKKS